MPRDTLAALRRIAERELVARQAVAVRLHARARAHAHVSAHARRQERRLRWSWTARGGARPTVQMHIRSGTLPDMMLARVGEQTFSA